MNKRDIAKILTIVFFSLAFLILLITLLLVYTPLNYLLFKKPIAEETTISEKEEPTLKEQATQEPTQKTEETTKKTTNEETTNREEATGVTTEEEEEIIGLLKISYKGPVKEIDYENKIIKVYDEYSEDIVELKIEEETKILSRPDKNKENDKFENIKVGYFVRIVAAKELKWSHSFKDLESPAFIYFSETDWLAGKTEIGFMHVSDAKHQGYVEDIDYENKIITIKNEITGEIEKLDDFSEYLSIKHYVISSNRLREFEDIKVGYYIFAATEKEMNFDIFYEPTDKILNIWLTEEFPPPGWPKEE